MIGVLVGLAVLVGLFGSAFFSGAETGLYCVNRLRLHLGVQQRDPRALRLAGVLDDEQGALSVALIGTNVMDYVTTTAVAFLFAELLRLGDADTELYTIVLVTPVVFVFGQVVPKNLFQLHADRLMMRGSTPLALANRLIRATGLVWLMKQVTGAVNRVCGVTTTYRASTAPKRRVAMLLQEALADHAHGEERSDLIDRVCRLSETPVRAIMVPQHRVTVIAEGAHRDELVRVVRETAHARVPVYSGRRSQIIGVVKTDELLRRDDWKTIDEHLYPIMALRPYDTVLAALVRMQAARRELAVVTDQAGHWLGMVTVRDLLEEVVGGLGDAEPSPVR